MAILKRGMSGEPVKRLQTKLGVEADGAFGPATEKALKDYQTQQKIAVDGIAGPDTFAHMGLHELILLKNGSKGETVKRLQEALNIGADGIYGSGTEAAVRAYQEKNGLKVDGLTGPETLAKLDQFEEITPETVKMSKAEAAPSKSIWESIKGIFD